MKILLSKSSSNRNKCDLDNIVHFLRKFDYFQNIESNWPLLEEHNYIYKLSKLLKIRVIKKGGFFEQD